MIAPLSSSKVSLHLSPPTTTFDRQTKVNQPPPSSGSPTPITAPYIAFFQSLVKKLRPSNMMSVSSLEAHLTAGLCRCEPESKKVLAGAVEKYLTGLYHEDPNEKQRAIAGLIAFLSAGMDQWIPTPFVIWNPKLLISALQKHLNSRQGKEPDDVTTQLENLVNELQALPKHPERSASDEVKKKYITDFKTAEKSATQAISDTIRALNMLA